MITDRQNRRISSAFIMLLFSFFNYTSFGQLSGIKSIPGNYPTISAAINDLNAQGVGAGGVTFNIAAGYTETLSARLNLTATGTVSNTIVFQKSGTGITPKLLLLPVQQHLPVQPRMEYGVFRALIM